MSEQNVETARRAFAELAARPAAENVTEDLSDERLAGFFHPEIEWLPLSQSLLASDSYLGYEGVRKFWSEFLSIWEEFEIEPSEFTPAGDHVTAVMRMRGRTHEIEVDELWSSLMTFREGRIVRVQGFRTPDGAREAAGQGG